MVYVIAIKIQPKFYYFPRFGLTMKYILAIALLLQLSVTKAQDATEESVDKPSWSEDMPERIDAPDIDLDSNLDTEIEMDELGMDRSDLFNDSDDDTRERPNFDLDDQADNDENKAAQEQAAVDKAAEEQAVADKAAEEQAAADKAAQEQAASDKAAEEQAAADKAAQEQATADIAAEEQAAIDKATQEQTTTDNTSQEQAAADNAALEQAAVDKAVLEQAAIDKAAQEQATADKAAQEQAAVSSPDQKTISYQWKKIANAAPKYPTRAARSGEEGWVEVEMEIDKNGDIVNATVANSYRNSKTFNREALNAVKKWKYEPPINYGIEENQFKTVKIVFKL